MKTETTRGNPKRKYSRYRHKEQLSEHSPNSPGNKPQT